MFIRSGGTARSTFNTGQVEKYPKTNMAGNHIKVPLVLEEDNYPNFFTFLSFSDCFPFEFHFYKLFCIKNCLFF